MDTIFALDPSVRIAELRRQHHAFSLEGYDGHNRRSGLTTMHRYALRRSRRVWRQRLALYSGAAAL
jgi:hypothetical protein